MAPSAGRLTVEERRARGLTIPYSVEPVVPRSGARTTASTGVLPTLPSPRPAEVKRIERVAERIEQAPPVRTPTPGTKAAGCQRAEHDIWHDENAGRWRWRTCDLERWHRTHPPKAPVTPCTTEHRGLLSRWLHR